MSRSKIQARDQDTIDPVMAEATRWFVTLHEEPSNTDLRPEFEAWRDSDTRHSVAYERLQKLWGASAHLPALVSQTPIADRRAFMRNAVGGGLAIAIIGGSGRLVMGAHPFADHRTRTGERSTVILADGSRIELSTSTALKVDFSNDLRRIRLLEGEAWFQVAKDMARPFVVEAAGGRTTALGTAFAVAVGKKNATVSVTEHLVNVASGGAVRRVFKGQGVRYDRKGIGAPVASDHTSLAWRDGRLAFVNLPLGDVVAEVDRWTGGHTMVLDKTLAAHPVTLTIGIEDAGDALHRLASILPVRITRLTSALTVLQSN